MRYIHLKALIATIVTVCGAASFASDRPELAAYPFWGEISETGDYTATTFGTNLVVTGEIEGDISVEASSDCRITLKGAVISGAITLTGSSNVQLWLEGENTITTSEATAIAATNVATLVIGGAGSLSATSAGGKKIGVVAASDLILAGGVTALTISGDNKNGRGVYLTGDYTQKAGALKVTATGSKKQNGIFMTYNKKERDPTAAMISGGVLEFNLSGEKSVGLAMDKSAISGEMTGGVVKIAMSGDGAKGIKGDGAFTMSGGVVDATMTGGYVEEYYQDEDYDWYHYVVIDANSKTTGNTYYGSDSIVTNATALIAAGTYPVYDPSKTYAIKVGTLTVSGGLIRVRCTGACGRGLGADSMYLSGGVYDITVEGAGTEVYFEPYEDALYTLIEDADTGDVTTNCTLAVVLDSGGAACLKTGDEEGELVITGGTFELKATGDCGKLINAKGALTIGDAASTTLPTDASFSPDIQGQVYGEKVFCTVFKQKYYGSITNATYVVEDEDTFTAMEFDVASENIVTGSSSSSTSSSGTGPGNDGPAGGGGADDDYDYSNAKGIKAEGDVTVNGGRIRVYTANDGGEGLESKNEMTINGGLIELECADDCINTASNLVINGGYIYAASTGNDGIDSNANIEINGGWVQSWTLSNPEEAFDVNSSYSVTINGGCVFGVGCAKSVRDGTLDGTQTSYQDSTTNALDSTATWYSMSGTDTIYCLIPATASGSAGWRFASVPGQSSSASLTKYGTSAPSSANAIGFHGFYTTGTVDSGSSDSGDEEEEEDETGSGSSTDDTSTTVSNAGTLTSYTYSNKSSSQSSYTTIDSYSAQYLVKAASSDTTDASVMVNGTSL